MVAVLISMITTLLTSALCTCITPVVWKTLLPLCSTLLVTRAASTHIELHVTELASPARPLDLEHCLPISIHDGEPGINEGAVLLDVANGGTNRCLDLHLLQAAKAAPGITAIGTYQMDHLKHEE